MSELLTETARVQAATHAVTQKLEGKAQEVGLLSEQLQRAQSEALADPLTGLKNRRAFDRALADMLAAPESGVAALLLIDIDHFKQVNDTHGHLVGDKVLRGIGATLASHIKGRDLAARLGGDEFAVLLRQTTHAGAISLAEQIRTSVANGKLHKADGSTLSGQVTVCVSIAIARVGDSVESLMGRADAGLYEAKQAGRNAVHRATSSERARGR
ncbi:MAG: GGDEF domain-containing protein [Sinobacteraceae bacterium]|nr:GGDEF domain-containing protein [Nevskiaceae bacterium]